MSTSRTEGRHASTVIHSRPCSEAVTTRATVNVATTATTVVATATAVVATTAVADATWFITIGIQSSHDFCEGGMCGDDRLGSFLADTRDLIEHT